MADQTNLPPWDTPEGKRVQEQYADILSARRPAPPPSRPRMSRENRAKIFSPFAALRGFDDELSEERAARSGEGGR